MANTCRRCAARLGTPAVRPECLPGVLYRTCPACGYSEAVRTRRPRRATLPVASALGQGTRVPRICPECDAGDPTSVLQECEHMRAADTRTRARLPGNTVRASVRVTTEPGRRPGRRPNV